MPTTDLMTPDAVPPGHENPLPVMASAGSQGRGLLGCLLGMLVTLAGCGGEVLLERTTGEGGRREARGTSGTNGPSEAVKGACTAYCNSFSSSCGPVGKCPDRCLEHASYAGPCEVEYLALLTCHASLVKAPPDCRLRGCEAEVEELLACIYPSGPCALRECRRGIGPEPPMSCSVNCGGVTYESICGELGSDYPIDCVCSVDGAIVGECQVLTRTGHFDFDCCSAFFADSEQRR